MHGTQVYNSLCLNILAVFLKGSAMDTYHLWDGLEKPFYKDNDLVEYEAVLWDTIRCVYKVTEPTLTVYPADNASIGVIVIPGGGYEFEAFDHEGYAVASALANAGVTAAVLKYRLPNPKSSDQPQFVPLTDAQRALKLMRQVTGLKKVGVIGFSAGSHLSTVLSLSKSADPEENPDFAGLIYGVTTPSDANREWLERCLYFRKMTEQELASSNLLEQVTRETPPSFLVHAYDDDMCPVGESVQYAQKLHEHGVPVEMHLFPKGGHGFGLGRESDGTNQWPGLFVRWVKSIS